MRIHKLKRAALLSLAFTIVRTMTFLMKGSTDSPGFLTTTPVADKTNTPIRGLSTTVPVAHKTNASTREFEHKTTTYHPIPDKHNKTEINPKILFEPEVNEDFPTLHSGSPRIPHIMHFIFITGTAEREGIPAQYYRNVILFTVLHPDWTVYFWSDISARIFIFLKFPSFLSTWNNYSRVIYKADALRYLVLYEFGGVYSDLDTEFLRPLDRVTMKYACIISPEPFEHSSILYLRPFQLNNGFLLCREKHPFMKQVISQLPQYAHRKKVIEVAGPKFLTKQFLIYNNLTADDLIRDKTDRDSNSPYFYKGDRKDDDIDAVYIPNTHYFMNSIDWGAPFEKLCHNVSSIFKLVKRGCELLQVKAKQDLNEFAFINHQWSHTYSIGKSAELLPIDSIVPKKQLNIWSP